MSASKPEWLKIRAPTGRIFEHTRSLLKTYHVHTVCDSAGCPNRVNCWSRGTATFQLLGDVCTRKCRFCACRSAEQGAPLDKEEIQRITRVAEALSLDYVVLTSVCRDDLPLGGAWHFAEAIRELKKQGCAVEALIPDFSGEETALELIIRASPDVVGHNLETVQRLQTHVRCREADYHTSLQVLSYIKKCQPQMTTKSSLMLGLGEREEEVLAAMRDLRSAGVDILTLGQYLRPDSEHLPVAEYLPPERFRYYLELAEHLGFRAVASAPFVRSSYKARALFYQLQGMLI